MELNKESIYKLETASDIKRFIVGGKAFITLESTKTGRWFTYKIKRAKKEDEKSPFFVSVLTGSDNESTYTYMGTLFNNNGFLTFRLTKNSKIGDQALSYKAFVLFFDFLLHDRIHSGMNIFHRGICSVCGKPITVPESLSTGIGPICAGRIGRNLELVETRKKKLQKINRSLTK